MDLDTLGVDALLMKPVEMQQLSETVSRRLGPAAHTTPQG